MKKTLSFLLFLIIIIQVNSQELPIDFSNSLHEFTSETGAIFNFDIDPYDATNDVGRIVSSDSYSDVITLQLETFLTVDNLSNNSISFDYYSDNTEVRTGGVRLADEQAVGYDIIVSFTTSGVIGWETITVDFDNAVYIYPNQNESVVYGNYGSIELIFSNLNPIQSFTYYIDNINGAETGEPYLVYEGDVSLTSQQEVNDFGAIGYTKTTGNFFIVSNTSSVSTDIIDLSPLLSIYQIEGRLEIDNNDSLINLDGLNNLRKIGRLTIENNLQLNSIQSLANITSSIGAFFGGYGLLIENNASLTDLDNLNVYSIYELRIDNNASLSSMSSFSTIAIGGSIYIENNPLLESIPDLNIPNNSLNDVSINNNDLLTTLPVINKRILERLEIIGNANISSLTGLESAPMGTNIIPLGEIYIHNNDNLTTLDGLNTDLSGTSGFSLINNDALVNIDLLSNFTIGVLTIDGNDSLLSLAPLSNYTGSILEIRGNDLLTNLNGLQNATSLTTLKIISTNLSSIDDLGSNTSLSILNIEDNPNLTSLNVFSSLTLVGNAGSNSFTIINNDNIVSLDGFENVTLGNCSFKVNNNANLVDFCAFSDLVNSGGIPVVPNTNIPRYSVFNNLYNPTIADFNNGNCSTLNIGEFNRFKVSVYPIPTLDFLNIITEGIIVNCDIYSLTGKKISSFRNTKIIDVRNLSTGVYFLKIIDSTNRTQNVKFIKS